MRKLICKNVDVLPGNDIAPPLTIDQVYPEKGVHLCACGEHHIDVGLLSEIKFVTCHKCREKLPDVSTEEGKVTHWCHSSRFEELTV
jgi:hypothetical protein